MRTATPFVEWLSRRYRATGVSIMGKVSDRCVRGCNARRTWLGDAVVGPINLGPVHQRSEGSSNGARRTRRSASVGASDSGGCVGIRTGVVVGMRENIRHPPTRLLNPPTSLGGSESGERDGTADGEVVRRRPLE